MGLRACACQRLTLSISELSVVGGWVGGQDKQLHGRTFTVSDENRHTKIHFFNSITFFFPTTQTEHELTIICYTLPSYEFEVNVFSAAAQQQIVI